MGLREVLQGMTAPRLGTACTVGTLLKGLPPGEAAECRKALEDKTIPSSMLTNAINTAYDAKLGKASVGRHRRGDCKCD